MSPPNATPLKEAELRALATCAHCHKKISETGIPTFFKVTIESHILNIPAIQRQQGLGMILGGGLALHMGADEDMTVTLDPRPPLFGGSLISRSCPWGLRPWFP